MQEARKSSVREKVSHTIRTNSADGKGRKTINGYTKSLAIKAHCTECMGFESNPADCTSVNCALYPFRKKTLIAYEK